MLQNVKMCDIVHFGNSDCRTNLFVILVKLTGEIIEITDFVGNVMSVQQGVNRKLHIHISVGRCVNIFIVMLLFFFNFFN